MNLTLNAHLVVAASTQLSTVVEETKLCSGMDEKRNFSLILTTNKAFNSVCRWEFIMKFKPNHVVLSIEHVHGCTNELLLFFFFFLVRVSWESFFSRVILVRFSIRQFLWIDSRRSWAIWISFYFFKFSTLCIIYHKKINKKFTWTRLDECLLDSRLLFHPVFHFWLGNCRRNWYKCTRMHSLTNPTPWRVCSVCSQTVVSNIHNNVQQWKLKVSKS